MALKDLVPWNRGRAVSVRRDDDTNPLLALHREVNRLFDDVFRGVGASAFTALSDFGERGLGWPNIEISENASEVIVTAELPGLEENDIHIQFANGVLAISGEKKASTEDKDRRFSERFYGRFERHIPLDDVDEENVDASFKNGVLTVKLPRTQAAKSKIRRIAINGR